ncbi:MAG: hypothetical protein M9958_00500 [Chitinophagales bacterium]|nr:hypothetical protein [Chitinophagales bacterium]
MNKSQIQEWKTKHGEIFELEVDGKKAWLKKPDRKLIAMAQSLGGESQVSIGEVLLDACWLGGDEEIKTNDDLFLSILPTLNQLIEIKQAVLKKI